MEIPEVKRVMTRVYFCVWLIVANLKPVFGGSFLIDPLFVLWCFGVNSWYVWTLVFIRYTL